MEVVDDYLSQEEFNTIRNHLYNDGIWAFIEGIDYKDDEDKFQFVHYYISKSIQVSKYLNILLPITNKIKPVVFTRIKANFLTRTPTVTENRYHVDIKLKRKNKVRDWTTSIFYVNTNNGYTKFEDGTKIESVANRFITFPANRKHLGTSCTDQNSRDVINFNYYL